MRAAMTAASVLSLTRNGKCWSSQFSSYIKTNVPNAFSARSN